MEVQDFRNSVEIHLQIMQDFQQRKTTNGKKLLDKEMQLPKDSRTQAQMAAVKSHFLLQLYNKSWKQMEGPTNQEIILWSIA